jgi:hypothetical protein
MARREDVIAMPKTFAALGPKQRRFMLKAMNEGVALDDPLATRERTGNLKAAGLIHQRTSRKGRTTWRCTDVGRGLVMAHVPVFLHVRGFPSYTKSSHEAMLGEPEVAGDVDASALSMSAPRRKLEAGETLRESLAAMKARNAERYAA